MNRNNFQQEIDRAIEHLVEEVTEIARRAALQAMRSRFERPGGAASAAAPAAVPGPPRARRDRKRTAEEIEALAQRLVAFVTGNPGLRIEQINRALGTTTQDLALPIRKLVTDGRIRVKGRKRSTTYFAAGTA